MIDISKIKKLLPESELSEIQPCTTKGKVQFHLLLSGKREITHKILDISYLAGAMDADKNFSDIKKSPELGVVKAKYENADLSVLASGRVVVRNVDDEKQAQNILETLAPILKNSIF